MHLNFCTLGKGIGKENQSLIMDCKVRKINKFDKIINDCGLVLGIYKLIKMNPEPIVNNNLSALKHVLSNDSISFVCENVKNGKLIFLITRDLKNINNHMQTYMILHEIGHILNPPKWNGNILKYNIDNELNADIFAYNYFIEHNWIEDLNTFIARLLSRIRHFELSDVLEKHNKIYYFSSLIFLNCVILGRKYKNANVDAMNYCKSMKGLSENDKQ